MNRLLLRTLNPILFILIALLGFAIQTSLFKWNSLSWLMPELIVIFIIWCALKREFLEGGVLVLLLSSFAESHSASPQGALLLHGMIIYLAVRALTNYFVVGHIKQWLILTALCISFWSISHQVFLYLFTNTLPPLFYLILQWIEKLFATCLASYFIYPFLDQFDILTYKKKERINRLENDIQIFEEEII